MEEIQETQGEEKKVNGNDVFKIKEKIYEMILYGNPQLKDFPKTERYVLAGDIRKTMYGMLEMAVRLEKKYHKKTTLQDLDIEVDVLRNLLRLAKDPNLYPKQKPCLDFHTWEVWIRKVDEIGRMIGGYMECAGDCSNCPNYTESYFCGFITPYCKLQGKEITHNVY